jgi:predicted alpha/beta superfamily hydrolase
MRNFYYTCLLSIMSFGAAAQIQPAFNIGFRDSIKSKILNEERHLLIFTPYSTRKIKPSTKEIYPVLYVLDGESHFRYIAATVERLVNNGSCPPMIVVGIPNTDRTRDLTPLALSGNVDGLKNSGGGEKFMSFIEMELLPYIESTYPVAPYKIILGHSLAGLMVIHTLTHNEQLFNAYIAIDAAIWWDNHKVLDEAKSALETKRYTNRTLFLAMANRMERGIDTTAVQLDSSEQTELIRYNLTLTHFINGHLKSDLRFKAAYYENERHGTITFVAAYDALRFLFNYFELPQYANYTTDNPELLSLIEEHYGNISKRLGYVVLPPQSLINSLGYRALSQKQFPVAKQLFNMNVVNFPDDANLMDSQGDYYSSVGDTMNAIHWYQKALARIEIKETRDKLNKLLTARKK